jgi:pantoate--beta-alanine ligase
MKVINNLTDLNKILRQRSAGSIDDSLSQNGDLSLLEDSDKKLMRSAKPEKSDSVTAQRLTDGSLAHRPAELKNRADLLQQLARLADTESLEVQRLARLEDSGNLADQQAAKSTLALVPTMGALHAGHLSLVKEALKHADQVMVTIYVNPLQFGVNEDFSAYPRTEAADLEKLAEAKVDYVFVPPAGFADTAPSISANAQLASILCGQQRPGHFDGVVSIVNHFFELIKPDYAVFGEKDYQQLLIIKEMARRLQPQLKIVAAPIMRAASGLALSSRNAYLSTEDKVKAALLYQTLNELADLFKKYLSFEKLKQDIELAKANLTALGFSIDYLETHYERLFIAAKIAGVRLIDNIALK